MEPTLEASAVEQARRVRDGSISSVELVGAHLRHIERVDTAIHAVVEPLAERALAAAREADDALARGGPLGPFHGVPFSIKDSLEVSGTRCTAGTAGRACAQPSAADATLVARLRQAGGIPIAKTNLPDLLFAFETDNLIFGRTKNPYSLERTPGGSSGGEAALIAACGSPMGLGSDCAGSVRLPAAFCGIAGLKPTSGRLPRTRHFPPAGGWIEALWQIGPMARRVEDLSAMMQVLAGSDGEDPTAVDLGFTPLDSRRLSELRVAFFTDDAVPEVAAVVRSAAQALSGTVRSIEESRPGCFGETYDLEMKLLGADGGDALRSYLHDLGSTRLHPLLSAWLKKLEAYRTDLAGFQAYWNEWTDYRLRMCEFFRPYDVLLCPAYPQPALPHGASTLDANFRGFRATMAFNLSGLPAAVVRCGASGDGLPIAVQVASRAWREDVALAVSARLEEIFGGWQAPAI